MDWCVATFGVWTTLRSHRLEFGSLLDHLVWGVDTSGVTQTMIWHLLVSHFEHPQSHKLWGPDIPGVTDRDKDMAKDI